MEDLSAQDYVKTQFPPKSKDACKEMVQYVLNEFEVRIKGLAWMSEATKVKALEKLATFRVKIVYPDQWKDYSLLENLVSRTKPYLTNIRYANTLKFIHEFERLSMTVDREKWGMPAFMVNACKFC